MNKKMLFMLVLCLVLAVNVVGSIGSGSGTYARAQIRQDYPEPDMLPGYAYSHTISVEGWE